MSDLKTLKDLQQIVGAPFPHTLEDGNCTELRLSCESALLHGLIRNHTPAAKQDALRLVSQLRHLRRLDMRRNLLRQLPAEFAELRSLEHLILGSNYFGCVPEQIRGLTRLKSLHLGNNDLTSLPPWMSEFVHLEYLALHKNLYLKAVDSLRSLTQLRNINMYFVPLTNFPAFLFEFPHLSTLSLWNIPRFPHELDAMRSLQFFTLCGTPSMRAFPPGFTRMKALRMARLYQNNIETIPDEIGEMAQLEQISLYQNQITALPDSMSRLQRMTKLNLGCNRLTTAPEWLTRLPQLDWLALFDNPLNNARGLTFRPQVRVEWDWPYTSELDGN